MSDQSKQRFEPPPWEQEAFERFRKAQDAARAQEELDAALLEVRSPLTPDAIQPGGETADDATASAMAPPESPVPEVGQRAPSEARIDAMLIQLRGEETPPPTPGKGLMYGAMAFLAAGGAYMIIQSAVLFGDVKTGTSAGKLLASLLLLVVLLIGFGFLGGAFFLFRRYRQHL